MRIPRISSCVAAASLLAMGSLPAQIVISGNESKIDLNPGAPTVVQNAKSDSISILDFSIFPPKVTHIMDVPNLRSSHEIATQKSGGILIVVTFLLGTIVIFFVADATMIRQDYFFAFGFTAVLIAAISLYDDV